MASDQLVFGFQALTLLLGAASIGFTLAVLGMHRRRLVLRYLLFLASLFLFSLTFTLSQYGRLLGVEESPALRAAHFAFTSAAGLLYVFNAPFFYHELLGLGACAALRRVYLLVDAVMVLFWAASLVLPDPAVPYLALNTILFATILYGIVLMAARFATIGNRALRRAVLFFVLLSAVFFPLMYLESMGGVLLPGRGMNGLMLAQPLYFFILTASTIVFASRTLNRPPYREAGRLTGYFSSSFGITPREAEIVELLYEGRTVREIGDRLFISPKTVENHVYSIYGKLNVRNRLQLFSLIRTNAAES